MHVSADRPLLRAAEAGTLAEMARELDAGGVLATCACPIRERDSLDRVMVEAKRAGALLVIDVLRRLAAGELVAQPLDMTEAAYYSFPTAAAVKEFRRRGHRLL
jgi:methionyl-tRNA formyltransferase